MTTTLLPQPARDSVSSSAFPIASPLYSARSLLKSAGSASASTGANLAASTPTFTKSILIVGAGTGGIGALLGLLAVPERHRQDWNIEVLEKRADVGGIWFPQPTPPGAPGLPDTPLYDALYTNTPIPTMAFPGIPFPAGTPMYPRHETIREYHRSTVDNCDLRRYIQLEHSVIDSAWTGTNWAVKVFKPNGREELRFYDHLVVANGHYKYPRQTTWEGVEEWKAAASGRKMLHSLWYRRPELFAQKDVVVVGFGASGMDIAQHVRRHAARTFHSYDPRPQGTPGAFPPLQGVTAKPRISHLNAHGIVFTDGSILDSAEVTIIIATGYELLAPWVSNLAVGPLKQSTTALTTNGRYIRPLHHQLLAADPSIPSDALAFITLPFFIANGPCAYAQGLFLGHTFADKDFLPPNEEILAGLTEHETAVRASGAEPFAIGHQFTAPGHAEAYQNELIKAIRSRSKVALPSYLDGNVDYVEDWRLHGRAKCFFLRKAWRRVVRMNLEDEFVKDVATEAEWAAAMLKLDLWEQEQDLTDPTGLLE